LSGLYGLLSAVILLLALRYWEFGVGWYLAVAVPIVVAVIAGVAAAVAAFSLTRMNAYIAAWRGLEEQ